MINRVPSTNTSIPAIHGQMGFFGCSCAVGSGVLSVAGAAFVSITGGGSVGASFSFAVRVSGNEKGSWVFADVLALDELDLPLLPPPLPPPPPPLPPPLPELPVLLDELDDIKLTVASLIDGVLSANPVLL